MEKVQRRKQVLLNHLVQSEKKSTLVKSPTRSRKITPPKQVVFYSAENGVSYITINNSPVNALAPAVMKGLAEKFQEALQDTTTRAIVFKSALPRFFVAGADISQFPKLQSQPKSESDKFLTIANNLLNSFESSEKPTVAAINGAALGGGLEIAMACNARVATAKSSLGLPELTLGIIPGYGGTQRLPRLVGVQKAAEMMLTSRPIKGVQGKKFGLIDELASGDEDLLNKASTLALAIADGKIPRRKSLFLTKKLGSMKMVRQIVKFAGEKAKKANPHVNHTHACLSALLVGAEKGGIVGLEAEKKAFLSLISSNTAKALIHFFFASKAISKIPGEKVKPKIIKKIGILGGGLMGSGIAIACLLAGYTVFLKEINEKYLTMGLNRVKGTLKRRVNKNKMTQEKYDSIINDKLVGKLDYSDFETLDLVVEAVIEKEDLKQRIFKDLENYCNDECILASNTSTIDIAVIGQHTNCQDRILGLHFFSPAHVMPLLEIVKTKHTSNQTLQTCLSFGKRIRKMSVVVGNCVGFTVNRIFFPYGVATHYLIDNGIHPYRIDEIVKTKFGMPMGPCRLYDMTGIDIIYHVQGSVGGAYADLQYPMTLINDLTLKHKRLGQKTGAGYYRYEKGNKKAIKDHEFLDKAIAAIRNPGVKPLYLTDEEIIEYIFYPVVNESCKVFEENMVYRGSDIDVASTLGMGFPAHLGGVMKWGDLVGARKIYDKLNGLYKSTGQRLFKPSKHLRDSAMRGSSLFVKL